MAPLKLPEVPEIFGNNVVVSKEVWNTLIQYVNLMQRTINVQANEILLLNTRMSKTEQNVATLAKALGGIYDANS